MLVTSYLVCTLVAQEWVTAPQTHFPSPLLRASEVNTVLPGPRVICSPGSGAFTKPFVADLPFLTLPTFCGSLVNADWWAFPARGETACPHIPPIGTTRRMLLNHYPLLYHLALFTSLA